jgi:serine/threonine protein kinase
MREGVTLAGRYLLGEQLGQGAAGSTWRGVESSGGRPVVVKALELRRLQGWKDVELLEREARVLRSLDHERIPRYVDSFREELEGAAVFVLVQEFIPGTSLQYRVAGGWRGTETEIRDIGAQILHILGYIHSLRPPLVHRDLNPGNLIRREDGRIFLVDFGAVQDAIRLESGGSTTVIGTPGYVPMEQYVGRATVRSDYYAFAATLLFLLSHRSPADFPLSNLKIDFSALNGLSRDLELILANWLEPDETRRTLRPEKALALLEGREAPPAEAPGAAVQPRKPHGSRVQVTETSDSLTIRFKERVPGQFLLAGFVALFLALMTAMVAISAVNQPNFLFVFFLFVPFSAAGLLFPGLFGRITLELSGSRGFRWARKFLWSKELTAPLADLGRCVSRTLYVLNNRPQNVLELEVGAKTIKFGGSLSEREKQWLAELINRKAQELSALPGHEPAAGTLMP